MHLTFDEVKVTNKRAQYTLSHRVKGVSLAPPHWWYDWWHRWFQPGGLGNENARSRWRRWAYPRATAPEWAANHGHRIRNGCARVSNNGRWALPVRESFVIVVPTPSFWYASRIPRCLGWPARRRCWRQRSVVVSLSSRNWCLVVPKHAPCLTTFAHIFTLHLRKDRY